MFDVNRAIFAVLVAILLSNYYALFLLDRTLQKILEELRRQK